MIDSFVSTNRDEQLETSKLNDPTVGEVDKLMRGLKQISGPVMTGLLATRAILVMVVPLFTPLSVFAIGMVCDDF